MNEPQSGETLFDTAICLIVSLAFIFGVVGIAGRREYKGILFDAYVMGLAAAGELDELRALLNKFKRRWGRESRRRRRVLEGLILNLAREKSRRLFKTSQGAFDSSRIGRFRQ